MRANADVYNSLNDCASILPAQFECINRASSDTTPEKRLMIAVLTSAILSYSRGPEDRHFMESHRWFFSDDGAGWLYSFRNICESLGFDPDFLRKGLLCFEGKFTHRSIRIRFKTCAVPMYLVRSQKRNR